MKKWEQMSELKKSLAAIGIAILVGALFILLFLLVVWPEIPLAWANGLTAVVTVIMFLTLCLYIPEFRRMIRSWDRKQVMKK